MKLQNCTPSNICCVNEQVLEINKKKTENDKTLQDQSKKTNNNKNRKEFIASSGGSKEEFAVSMDRTHFSFNCED